MPNITTYEFGEVVLVYYYHTDGSPAEKRPAVIVSSDLHNRDDIDIVLMQVTSQQQHEARHGAFVIREWLQIGLRYPSVIKPVLFTYEKEQVIRRFGRLTPASRLELKKLLAKIFGFKVASPSST